MDFNDRWQMEYFEMLSEIFKENRHVVALTYDCKGADYNDSEKLTALLKHLFDYAYEHGFKTLSISYFGDVCKVGIIVNEESDYEYFARYVWENMEGLGK